MPSSNSRSDPIISIDSAFFKGHGEKPIIIIQACRTEATKRPETSELAELRELSDEITIYEARTNQGYVNGKGDDLSQPVEATGDDDRFKLMFENYNAQVSTPPTSSPPQSRPPIFIVQVSSRYTKCHGFGITPEEAVRALLLTWRVDYAPDAEADEGFLAEVRPDMKIYRVQLGQGFIDSPEEGHFTRPIAMFGNDAAIERAFRDYQALAKPWQQADA